MLVGFSDRFGELVCLLRRRLGWASVRDALYLDTNHYRHPTAGDWPILAARRLNASAAVRGDWLFLASAEDMYTQQVGAAAGSPGRRGLSLIPHPSIASSSPSAAFCTQN